MLGTKYRSAEVEFAKRSQENRDVAAATFGAELLAELLNRTLVVREAYWLWWERHRVAVDATPAAAAGLTERDMLGILDNVLRTFVQDCDEVRARGRRARRRRLTMQRASSTWEASLWNRDVPDTHP